MGGERGGGGRGGGGGGIEIAGECEGSELVGGAAGEDVGAVELAGVETESLAGGVGVAREAFGAAGEAPRLRVRDADGTNSVADLVNGGNATFTLNTAAQTVNPTPMPPGSIAGNAPGMSPGAPAPMTVPPGTRARLMSWARLISGRARMLAKTRS